MTTENQMTEPTKPTIDAGKALDASIALLKAESAARLELAARIRARTAAFLDRCVRWSDRE